MSVQTARWLLVMYLGVLAFLVFFPFGSGMDLGDGLNLRMWKTIHKALERGPETLAFRLFVGNIIAFVPFGILLPAAVRSRWAVVLVLPAALLLSVGIEAGQYVISQAVGYSYRSTDVDDVVLNVTGAMIGAALFALWAQLRRAARAHRPESG